MGSQYPPAFYDDEAVTTLAQAYQQVWKAVMTDDDPFRDFGTSEKLRQRIVETMLELAAEGVLSVDELRDKTLARVTISRQSPISTRHLGGRLKKDRGRRYREAT